MPERRYILVVVETAHIQSYIFASNRLKENVGASYLVAAATGEWALETLDTMKLHTNLTDNADTPFNDRQIEDGLLDVEVLYSGGGNIVLLFAESGFAATEFGESALPETALSRQFIRHLSRRVQQDAPGLKLTFAAAPFEWQQSLSAAVGTLLQTMKQQRSLQPALRGDGGLGVQIMDSSTSLPTITMERDPDGRWQPYSAETVAKRTAAEAANRLLGKTLALDQTEYRFALELDDLGRSVDDTSYIAVVHADGNGLGLLIQELQDRFPAKKNLEYIQYMRQFSEQVKQVARLAQGEMIKLLLESIEVDDGERYLKPVSGKAEPIKLKRREGKMIFPIRPLVSGGDDVTFVCDGRIALDLTALFLRAFEKYSTSILKKPLTACAGIAIVKTHYPFARAYALADDLAGNAKQARYALGSDQAPSAFDWHITAGGLYGDLDSMREREYHVEDGSLTLRPVFVADHPALRSWSLMQRMITEFQVRWQDHRNKAEGLREALRKGAVETAVYKIRYLTASRKTWSKGLPPYLPEIAGFNDNGWLEGYCGYYDALELMDKYIPLQSSESIRS